MPEDFFGVGKDTVPEFIQKAIELLFDLQEVVEQIHGYKKALTQRILFQVRDSIRGEN